MHAGSDHSGAAKEEIGREPVIMLKDAPGTSEKGARVFALLPKRLAHASARTGPDMIRPVDRELLRSYNEA